MRSRTQSVGMCRSGERVPPVTAKQRENMHGKEQRSEKATSAVWRPLA